MIEPWEVKLKKVDRKTWSDPSQQHKCSDLRCMNTKVLYGVPNQHNDDRFMSFRPGPTISAVDKTAFKRIEQQRNLPMFGDRDKDGIKNIMDRRPFIKDKKQRFKI